MTYEIVNGKARKIEEYTREKPYAVAIGMNGRKYVPLASVTDKVCHIATGNTKTGSAVLNLNLSIENTCDKRFPCYKDCLCYAENGAYSFLGNQALYSETTAFCLSHTAQEISLVLSAAIAEASAKKFRYFTCGDIPTVSFIAAMVRTAIDNPTVKFWAYTKKYALVNKYIRDNGNSLAAALPVNLKIIFSVWRFENGDIIPIDNPYNLPTADYIPMGQEQLTASVNHICPCSDPAFIGTCDNCDNPCYELLPGQTMALLAHSIAKTKARDKALKTAKESAKKALKSA